MQYVFLQDYDNLCLVMDLLNGEDLRYHISRQRKLSERQTSNQNIYLEFFIACVVLGLEYIHNNEIYTGMSSQKI
jgi:hypothetical protein